MGPTKKSFRFSDGYIIPVVVTRTNTYGKEGNVLWMQ